MIEQMSGSADAKRTWECLFCHTTPRTDAHDPNRANCDCREWVLERRRNGYGGTIADFVWEAGI